MQQQLSMNLVLPSLRPNQQHACHTLKPLKDQIPLGWISLCKVVSLNNSLIAKPKVEAGLERLLSKRQISRRRIFCFHNYIFAQQYKSWLRSTEQLKNYSFPLFDCFAYNILNNVVFKDSIEQQWNFHSNLYIHSHLFMRGNFKNVLHHWCMRGNFKNVLHHWCEIWDKHRKNQNNQFWANRHQVVLVSFK